jgi:hypothetical protein
MKLVVLTTNSDEMGLQERGITVQLQNRGSCAAATTAEG